MTKQSFGTDMPAKANILKRASRRAAALGIATLVASSALVGAGCGRPPVEEGGFPARGNITGTVVYTGPLPCTQGGRVVGGAVMLAFKDNLLPPPEGLATTAAQVAVVSGDVLFESVYDKLPSSTDPSAIVCPPAGTPNVTVSAEWNLGPVDAGRWQVRGFYDYDGDFNPLLKLHQLPTIGDVAGGAIANATEVLQGLPPRYQTISIGVANSQGELRMPETGSQVDGVTVTLAQVLNTPRPVFHFTGMVAPGQPALNADGTSQVGMDGQPVTNITQDFVLPSDVRLSTTPAVDPSIFYQMVLAAGLPAAEQEVGVASPYFIQGAPPYTKFAVGGALNTDGTPRAIADNPLVADIFPQVIFGKLDTETGRGLQTAQANPAVILQGLVLRNASLIDSFVNNVAPGGALAAKELKESLVVALRPSVICLDPLDSSKPAYVISPDFKATDGGDIIQQANVEPALKVLLGRSEIVFKKGCLPGGQYQANVVYDTGQAWTLPNEAGECDPVNESTLASGLGCSQPKFGNRTLLSSQVQTLTITNPADSAFCQQEYGDKEGYRGGVPVECLPAQLVGLMNRPELARLITSRWLTNSLAVAYAHGLAASGRFI